MPKISSAPNTVKSLFQGHLKLVSLDVSTLQIHKYLFLVLVFVILGKFR